MHGYNLGKVGGIRIVVDPTWLFIFALVVWSLATSYFPGLDARLAEGEAWVMGIVAGLLLFASVLVHELSHALLARRAGIDVPRIRLFLFGGVSEMASEPREPRAELRIAAAGPLTSIGLAALFWLISASGFAALLPGGQPVVEYLALINLALGLFNLLPGFPLDGGRILRAWLWSRHGNVLRATRTAGRAGSFLGYGLMFVGVVRLVQRDLIGGLWMILIGMFLNQAAGASYQMLLIRDLLSGVRVKQLMTQPVVTVPEHTSLEELVSDYFYRYPYAGFPVASGDRLAGTISLEQLKGVPREDWVRTPVRQVMTPAIDLRPVGPEDDCVTVLERMLREDVGRLPVVLDGRIVGILSRRDVMRLFKIRSDLAS
ncbi:MAG TPA: site-2 protease family protein [Candidatus Polarisedimenticolia bacterium]|nr:site-2 protease family protein [Candidatus Polarisedimenticolia bacterium]